MCPTERPEVVYRRSGYFSCILIYIYICIYANLCARGYLDGNASLAVVLFGLPLLRESLDVRPPLVRLAGCGREEDSLVLPVFLSGFVAVVQGNASSSFRTE